MRETGREGEEEIRIGPKCVKCSGAESILRSNRSPSEPQELRTTVCMFVCLVHVQADRQRLMNAHTLKHACVVSHKCVGKVSTTNQYVKMHTCARTNSKPSQRLMELDAVRPQTNLKHSEGLAGADRCRL